MNELSLIVCRSLFLSICMKLLWVFRCLKEEVAVQTDKHLISIVVQRPKITIIEKKVNSNHTLWTFCCHLCSKCTKKHKKLVQVRGRRPWVRAFSVALAVSGSWESNACGNRFFYINLLLIIRETIVKLLRVKLFRQVLFPEQNI